MLKPAYCTNLKAANCRECSLSSYGRDCLNFPIPEEGTGRIRERPREATVNLSALTGGYPAEFEYLGRYIDAALELAGEAEEVSLTGEGPAWLVMAVSNALRGQGKRVSLGPGAVVDLEADGKERNGDGDS